MEEFVAVGNVVIVSVVSVVGVFVVVAVSVVVAGFIAWVLPLCVRGAAVLCCSVVVAVFLAGVLIIVGPPFVLVGFVVVHVFTSCGHLLLLVL